MILELSVGIRTPQKTQGNRLFLGRRSPSVSFSNTFTKSSNSPIKVHIWIAVSVRDFASELKSGVAVIFPDNMRPAVPAANPDCRRNREASHLVRRSVSICKFSDLLSRLVAHQGHHAV